MKSASSVRHNITANFAGKAWKGIFSLAFVPIYIQLMGVEVYGLIGIFMSLTALLALLDMGLSATLNRELSRLSVAEDSAQESRNLVRTFEVIYWGIGVLIGIVVVVLAPIIAKYWITSTTISNEIIEQALLIMGMLLAFQWPGTIYTGGLRGLQRQVLLNVIQGVSIMARHFGAVLVLLFISPSIVLFFFWQALVALFSTIILAVWLWKSLPRTGKKSIFDKRLLVKNWKFTSGMIGISLVTIILTQLDKIILSKMLTLEMFGYYMLAFSVASVLASLVNPVHSALFPRLSQLVAGGSEAEISELYHKGCQLVSIIILPIAVTLVFFAEEILILWVGDPVIVRNTHMILSLLVIGTVINGLMTLPYTLQLAYGWTKLTLYKNIIAVILLVPLMVWMVQMYHGIGAALAWVILNLGYIILEIPIMHKRLLKNEMGKWYKRDIILPVLIVTIIGFIAQEILPADSSKLVMLLVMLSTCALTFAASAWATGNLNSKSLSILRSKNRAIKVQAESITSEKYKPK